MPAPHWSSFPHGTAARRTFSHPRHLPVYPPRQLLLPLLVAAAGSCLCKQGFPLPPASSAQHRGAGCEAEGSVFHSPAARPRGALPAQQQDGMLGGTTAAASALSLTAGSGLACLLPSPQLRVRILPLPLPLLVSDRRRRRLRCGWRRCLSRRRNVDLLLLLLLARCRLAPPIRSSAGRVGAAWLPRALLAAAAPRAGAALCRGRLPHRLCGREQHSLRLWVQHGYQGGKGPAA